MYAEGLQEAKRFGIASHVEDFEHALNDSLWIGGRWDELLPHLDAAIELGGGTAQTLIDDGRRAEADEQLQRALTFYRSVGATRYIREGEALLAASA